MSRLLYVVRIFPDFLVDVLLVQISLRSCGTFEKLLFYYTELIIFFLIFRCFTICGHEYHYQCLQDLQFKCQHCLDYLLNGVEYLGNLYNDRLESLDNTSILDEEEEEENIVDNEDNVSLENSEELILKENLNLDQSLKDALYAFQQIK